MAWTHAVAISASVAASLLFIAVGLRLQARAPVDAEPHKAVRAFGVWWVALGLNMAAFAAMTWAGSTGHREAAIVLRVASFFLIGTAFWGLLTYLLYIHFGRDLSRPVAWGYGGLVGATIAFFLWSGPKAVMVGAWHVDVVAARPPLEGLAEVLFTLAFLIPPIVAGGMFLALLRRGPTPPAQRRRIFVVGFGIPAWSLLHLAARLADADLWQFATRIGVGMVLALAVAWAYGRPPLFRMAGVPDLRVRMQELV